MDLRQLAIFVATAEEASFTHAAHRLGIAQPAVSMHIQRLERDLAQPLFDRSTRAVRLTAAGEAALAHARAALAAAADLRSAVDEVSDAVRGRIRIGAITTRGLGLSKTLADFRSRHLQVEISLTTGASGTLVEALGDGVLDMAVISVGSDFAPDDLNLEELRRNRLVAAVAVDHTVALRRSITLTALAQNTLIALPRGTGTRQQLEAAADAAGIGLCVALEADSVEAVAELASAGMGVGLLPHTEVRPESGLVAVDIVPELQVSLMLAWRCYSPISPAARALIDTIRQRHAARSADRTAVTDEARDDHGGHGPERATSNV